MILIVINTFYTPPFSIRSKLPMSWDDLTYIDIVFAIAISVLALLMFVIGIGLLGIQNQQAAISTILGAMLTLVTIYLMFEQTEIRRRQLDVEEQLLEYETEPKIEVIDRNFRESKIEVQLANYGHGVAQNLEIECLLLSPDSEWFEGSPTRISLQRYNEDADEVLEDNSIRPQEEPATFISEEILLGRIPEQETDATESTATTRLRELVENGEGNIELKITLYGYLITDDSCLVSTPVGESLTVPIGDLPPNPGLKALSDYQT